MRLLTGERGVGDHGGIHFVRDEQRHCIIVQQLWNMPGHLGSRLRHYFRRNHFQYRRGHNVWDQYGACLRTSDGISTPASALSSGVDLHSIHTQACPLGAGVAAQYLEQNPTHTPATVATALLDAATQMSASEFYSRGSPREFLYSDSFSDRYVHSLPRRPPTRDSSN
jgi:hypothetical protein